jgi:nitrate reductase alpha subunit
VQKTQPWPTLTRRIQFYIDHPFFLELGEELPVHKDSPPIGGRYPLQMIGEHTRWSVHASWRDEQNLLRLQRGGPVVRMSREDAQARSIAEGERVRVRNDIGAFVAQVRISPAVRPGELAVEQGWEPYHFEGRSSYQSAVPSPINPLQVAGGFFHLQPSILIGSAGGVDRGTRVEVKRL